MENHILEAVVNAIKILYNNEIISTDIQVQRTKKEYEGDYTIVVFPLVRFSKKKPADTANEIGEYLKAELNDIKAFNVINGFLNLSFTDEYWLNILQKFIDKKSLELPSNGKKQMIEYSSPNTNKPLHLGHIRNNLLGDSISRILKANGYNIIEVNLINDRGIHICKSMLAYIKWGDNTTPEKEGIKGDKLIGNFYVKFEKEYRSEIKALVEKGIDENDAKKQAPLIIEAQELLKKWENSDAEVVALWTKLNNWVYKGFDKTYDYLGISFDKIYYESVTYKLGKNMVNKGLEKGVFFKKENGSVWSDLTAEGLDEKLLLRADGTTVYMTQDLGTAYERFEEYSPEKLLYVVGNEQKYHFEVLKVILGKLGYEWAKNITHISYGMVELPEGKMKSREGKVVDADDLLTEMYTTAENTSEESGKLKELPIEEQKVTLKNISLAALKYFLLKVDPKKKMMFNPKESIDFNGNTGPFIQYSNARINSIIRKSKEQNFDIENYQLHGTSITQKEISLLININTYDSILRDAGKNLNPGAIANYSYDLAKEFNQFYHDHHILNENDEQIKKFRLLLSLQVKNVLEFSMGLLGINMPARM